MKGPSIESINDSSNGKGRRAAWGLLFAGSVFLFLIGLSLLSSSFSQLGEPAAKELIKATSNPFIGLFVGILVTAVLQSSSTTTSMIVAIVGGGTLGDTADVETIGRAIPLIMGANIGTTVTSTIVSLGHIASKKEYRKAIAAATMHDFFNILTVLVLFPLEMAFGVLSQPVSFLAERLTIAETAQGAFGFMDYVISPLADLSHQFFGSFLPPEAIPFFGLAVALMLLFFSLRYITRILKNNLLARERTAIRKTLFETPVKSLGWGALITGLMQSSSVTTSLVVPMVATGKVSMSKAFPFIMGANIGTTTTALLASFLIPGSNPRAAVAIAISHLLFNLIGVIILFPVARVRRIPIRVARRLGYATLSNRLVGIIYILFTFFLLPFLMVLISGHG